MGDSVGVALDVVDVVRGDGGVGCLVRVGARSVWVVFRLVLAAFEVVQFAGGENFSARVVVCSVLGEVEVVQFAGGENVLARAVVCSVLDDVGVVSLDHCCSFLVFNFWNC